MRLIYFVRNIRSSARMSVFVVRSFRNHLTNMSDEVILVQSLIYEIRGKKVMLDFDLARLYHVETRALNQAVKRNIKRFPPDFMFQITREEWDKNSSQNVMTSNRPKTSPPFAFTEQGVAMLSGILKSDVAIAANIAIMRAFVQVREYLLTTSSWSAEIKELKARVDLLQFQQEDARKELSSLCAAIVRLAEELNGKKNVPMPRIGYKQSGKNKDS